MKNHSIKSNLGNKYPFNQLKFHIITFGCQMNKHDSERICGLLEYHGASAVNTIQESDIVVYMTCCVREAADVRLYGQASSIKNIPLRKGSPINNRIVAVGGCIGQRDGEELTKKIKNINIVFGTHNIASLPTLINNCINAAKSNENTYNKNVKSIEILDKSISFPTDLPTHRENPWSAWLPITIGCNNFCSYCIVPYVRGREKSRTIEDILAEAKLYIDQGVKEITLLGQNVNSYGRDLYGDTKFYDLLCKIDELNPARLRFATSHPKDLNDKIISCFGNLKSLMPALHLPVQSGSDKILHDMNRRYNAHHYLEIVEKLRNVNKDIALSTDIIVGFPGETEEDFLDTYNLINKVGYHQVFTFIYSKREGTPAAKINDNTPKSVIQNRFDRLVDLVAKRAYEVNQVDKNATIPVLIDGVSKKNKNVLTGKSPKNQTVHFTFDNNADSNCYTSTDKIDINSSYSEDSNKHCDSETDSSLTHNDINSDMFGKIVNVKIKEAKTWYLRGEIVE